MTRGELIDHLLMRLREVQERLGGDANATAGMPFAEAVDSMGLVEFVGVVAADCGVKPEAVEEVAQRRFGTITELAAAMYAARMLPRTKATQGTFGFAQEKEPAAQPTAWLAGWATAQPRLIQPTTDLDHLLARPDGWLEQHAGIRSRWRWHEQHPTAMAAAAAWDCADERRLRTLGALLATGEAPESPFDQTAALHRTLELGSTVPTIGVAGACLGFLQALWLGSRAVRPGADVLIVAQESHTRWLQTCPGPEGEAAALFGDGAAACLLTAGQEVGSLPLRDVILGSECDEGRLIQVHLDSSPPVVRMNGPALALRAVEQLAAVVRVICDRHGVSVEDLEAVHVHAGNGRMPPLVARRLGLPEDRIVSTTPFSGNLGSVSLLAALSHRPPAGTGPVVLAAVGAGLHWGAALFDARLA